MSSDKLKEEKIKDSLNTCLDHANITVSEKLIEKTLKRINEGNVINDNVEKDKVASIDDIAARNGKGKLKLISNLAAAALVLVVGIAMVNMTGLSRTKSSESMNASDSTAEYVDGTSYEEVESKEALTVAGAESEIAEDSTLMKDQTESAVEDSGAEYAANSLEDTSKGDADVMGDEPNHAGLKAQVTQGDDVEQGDNMTQADAITEADDMADTAEEDLAVQVEDDTDVFTQLLSIEPEKVEVILFRNILDAEDIKITDKQRVNEFYECMELVQYHNSNTNITDPGGWDFVIEIQGTTESYSIWIGDYIIVEEIIGDEENSISYEASDIDLLLNALSTYYVTIK